MHHNYLLYFMLPYLQTLSTLKPNHYHQHGPKRKTLSVTWCIAFLVDGGNEWMKSDAVKVKTIKIHLVAEQPPPPLT